MMSETQAKTVEVNGVELEEGTDLWRLATLRTYNQRISEQDPDAVIRETAEALVENYPETVNNAPLEVVEANLKGTPGIYNGKDVMRYHAMEVTEIYTWDDGKRVVLKDWKEEKYYSFTTVADEKDDTRWTTVEPFKALEAHLGVTILPVEE